MTTSQAVKVRLAASNVGYWYDIAPRDIDQVSVKSLYVIA